MPEKIGSDVLKKKFPKYMFKSPIATLKTFKNVDEVIGRWNSTRDGFDIIVSKGEKDSKFFVNKVLLRKVSGELCGIEATDIRFDNVKHAKVITGGEKLMPEKLRKNRKR